MHSREHTSLLADVARRFYLLDETKSQIADALGISRFKVARLLTEAKETGVATIEIHDGSPISPNLAPCLRDHLKLKDVIITPSCRDMDTERDSMAAPAHDTYAIVCTKAKWLGSPGDAP